MSNQNSARRLLSNQAWIAVVGLAVVALSPLAVRGEEAPKTAPRIFFVPGEDPTNVGLWVSKAPFGEVASALEQELKCQVEVSGRLVQLPFTGKLSPRSPERLFPALARRLNCRLQLGYRLGKPPSGAPYENQDSPLADRPTPMLPVRTAEAPQVLAMLRQAGIAIESDPAAPPEGTVKVPRAGLSLRLTLDFLSRATHQTWWPVVRFIPRKSVDAAAESDDRRQTFYTDLLAFTPEERREEIAADLEAFDQLLLEQQDGALAQMVKDISSLGLIFTRTPEEHRFGVRARLRQIGADYGEVLASLPERRAELQPLIDAVRQLRASLREPG